MESLGKAGAAPFTAPLSPETPAPVVGDAGSKPPSGDSFQLQGAGKVEDKPLESSILTGTIRTKFPVNDLGSIDTHGRWAAGFVLDGGSVRLMWLTARRVNDAANKQGFEISFFLQGPAIATMKARMEKAGAQKTSFPFYAAELAPGAADGKSTLLRNGPSWTPGQAQALMVDVADKYTVHFADTQPEALKGAVRIRTYGDDAASSASLAQVIDKLGLQHVFAPSSKNALERFKLTRLLWATKPEALESVTWSSYAEVDNQALEHKLDELGLAPDHPAWKALSAIDLEDPKVQKRYRLARLLWDRQPKAFFDWIKAEQAAIHGVLPTLASGPETQLHQALAAAGLKPDSPEYQAALAAKKPTAAQVKKLFDLAFLVKSSAPLASSIIQRSLDEVSAAKLKGIVKNAGIDLSADRLDKLELREVYPGYFTAYDPTMPERLKEKGARYLYSTLDNPERVFEVLSAGQKASLTRFQEGRLVQGKSSAADFGTGGAFAVFSRLVTASAIDGAKKGTSGGGYGYASTFNNWGGSRPYKVILNRSILGRLDWYGYNGDNYGRSTNLKSANHAEAIVETINKSYSSSNELMFGVGNDPQFIDFVVCENEGQRAALTKYLEEHGLTSFRGKPLSELIRVETKFFEHPDDLTLEAAIHDAAAALPLKAAEDAVRALAGPYANEHAPAVTQKSAEAIAEETFPEVLKTLVQSSTSHLVHQETTKQVQAALAALSLTNVEAEATKAAEAVGHSTALEAPATLVSNSLWSIANQLQAPALAKALELMKLEGPAIAHQAAEEAKLAQPADAMPEVIKQAMINAAHQAVSAATKAKAGQDIKTSLLEQAQALAEKTLASNAQSQARQLLQGPMLEAGAVAGRAQAEAEGAIAPLIATITSEVPAKVGGEAAKKVAASLYTSLRTRVQQGTKARAEAAMSAEIGPQTAEAARAAGKAELEALLKTTVESWASKHPDQHFDPQDPALVAAALRRADDVAKWFAGAEIGQAIDKVLQPSVDAAAKAKAEADHSESIQATLSQIVLSSAETQILQQLRAKLNTALSKLVTDRAAARAQEWSSALAPGAATQALEQAGTNLASNYQLSQTARQVAEAEVKAMLAAPPPAPAAG